ncbi:MAG: imidazolonepropionase-like amidohydrolase [Alteromonadaceae bacterium]|jgi:imidazolonepropionase-like amidohydrolase
MKLPTLNKSLISKTLTAATLLALSVNAHAESLAIINATVHTSSVSGVLQNASVIIEDGVIVAINPSTVNADKTIDAKGKILTPGFIAAFSSLGLVEVGAVSETRDGGDDKSDIAFDPSLAFNPKTSAIPYSRKGGITRSIIAPSGGKKIFKGQTSVVNLSGELDSVVYANNALLVELGSLSKGSRALALQTLINTLDDAAEKLEKAQKEKAKASKDKKKDAKDEKTPSREEKIINAVLSGEKTILITSAHRASDLLELIKLKQRLNLNMVIEGAGEAIVVASQLAEAGIPVVINATQALPGDFDQLHPSLENAGKLAQAGVKVIIGTRGAHSLNLLRFDAGIAVAYGMTQQQALNALTSNIAEAFNLNAGSIEVGTPADLVLWTADPFELSSRVDTLWIDGKQHTTDSRQDALRKRYMTKSDMPPAYTK